MKKEKNHKLYRKMGFYERYIKRAIDIFCSGFGNNCILLAVCNHRSAGSNKTGKSSVVYSI